MRIPTVHVVIGFNRAAMNELFAVGASYNSILEKLSGDSASFIFSNKGNSNLIEFEHSCNMGREMNIMNLTFIDPKDEFERRFISDSAIRSIASLSKNFAVAGEISDADIKQKNEVEKSLSPADYEEFDKEFQASVAEQYIYVAYGVGSNLDYWSGPHMMTVAGADIKVEGSRKLTLSLVVNPRPLDEDARRGIYNEKVNIHLDGLSLEVEGKSKPFDFRRALDGGQLYTPTPPSLQKLEGKIFKALDATDYAGITATVQAIDFHLIIVDVIRDYIQKATSNPNVIVILPNLNWICRAAIQQFILESRFDEIAVQGASRPVASTISASTYRGFAGGGDAVYASPIDARKLGLYDTLLKTVLASFSINLATEWGSDKNDPVQAFGSQEGPAYFKEKEVLPFGKSWNSDAGLGSGYQARAVRYVDERNWYASKIHVTSEGLPNHRLVLKEIEDSINRNSKSLYSSNFVTFTETDTKVLNLWKKYGKLPMFAGKFNFNSGHPAIIYGDAILIKDFLYGKADFESKQQQVSEAQQQVVAVPIPGADYSNGIPSLPNSQTTPDFLKDAVTSLQNLVPLHPYEYAILFNQQYNKEITEIIYPNRILAADAFGNESEIPEGFGYFDEKWEEKSQEFLQEKGIPVFKYNTVNPNIIDMDFKFGSIYFSMLNQGYTKQVQRKVSAVAHGILPNEYADFKINTLDDLVAYIRLVHYSLDSGLEGPFTDSTEITADIISRVGPELAKKYIGDAPAAAQAALKEYTRLLEDPLKPLIRVDQLLPGTPPSMSVDFAEQMYRQALQLSIKTVPFYYLSTFGNTIFQPCLLFAQDTPIIQSKPRKWTILNNFFSGAYKIVGFTHTISTKSAESEFYLQKNTMSNTTREQEEEIAFEGKGMFEISKEESEKLAADTAEASAQLAELVARRAVGQAALDEKLAALDERHAQERIAETNLSVITAYSTETLGDTGDPFLQYNVVPFD